MPQIIQLFTFCWITLVALFLCCETSLFIPDVPIMTNTDSFWLSTITSFNEKASDLPIGNYKIISAGGYHTCAITNNNIVWCWGNNERGQLGNEKIAFSQAKPSVVSGLSTDLITISAGGHHTCALEGDHTVKCWGFNGAGSLGNGTTVDHAKPVTTIGLNGDIVAISSGKYHSCALTNNGSAKCWGFNIAGGVGDDSVVNRLSPVDVVGLNGDLKAISAGELHTCALHNNGNVKCWGSNSHGQLGDGTSITRTTPISVVNLEHEIVAISAGWLHTCALTREGLVKCWGANTHGQLGDGTNLDQRIPTYVTGLNNIIEIQASAYHTCALNKDKSVKCWGFNGAGELGDGSEIGKFLPVKVAGLGDDSILLSSAGPHTCVLTLNKKAKCWGYNEHGQIGDGTTITQSIPVWVNGITPPQVFLSFIKTPLCDCEPNNNFYEASQITTTTPVLGSVGGTVDTNDYYAIPLQGGKHYVVSLQFKGESDLDLYIYKPDRSLLGKSLSEINTSEQVTFTANETGQYYVLISPYNSTNVQSYELIISEQ